MEELFASGIKLAYPNYSFIIEGGEKTELSKIVSNRVICPSFNVCIKWLENEKNLSVLLSDRFADDLYANGDFVGNKSERLACMLEDGIFFRYGQSMFMFHGDPLMSRVNYIIDRVVEGGLYNQWVSKSLHYGKLISRKIAIVLPLDEYYSFNLYHMQPAFLLLLMGWCLSVLSFIVELLYNRILSKRL
jgi:hypothetical protein